MFIEWFEFTTYGENEKEEVVYRCVDEKRRRIEKNVKAYCVGSFENEKEEQRFGEARYKDEKRRTKEKNGQAYYVGSFGYEKEEEER
ncbi:unnamed protein product [Dovyalis caffra]|uniref:Phage protein n=1 Tax=Dovyalis caffra TaxID=77055 RepID=A0AAV1RI90_9ROSI|nr:unnamed protein product [Dovyalis caffra]